MPLHPSQWKKMKGHHISHSATVYLFRQELCIRLKNQGVYISQSKNPAGKCPKHSDEGWRLGRAGRRLDPMYEFCSGMHGVFVYSALTRASALIAKSSWILLSIQVDNFISVFYFDGTFFSLWIFLTFSCCILIWDNLYIILGGWQEMSREMFDSEISSM